MENDRISASFIKRLASEMLPDYWHNELYAYIDGLPRLHLTNTDWRDHILVADDLVWENVALMAGIDLVVSHTMFEVVRFPIAVICFGTLTVGWKNRQILNLSNGCPFWTIDQTLDTYDGIMGEL